MLMKHLFYLFIARKQEHRMPKQIRLQAIVCLKEIRTTPNLCSRHDPPLLMLISDEPLL
jgi:hypothetical protein